jgi:hypothetical protein
MNEPAMPVLYSVKPPVQTVTVWAYCRQSRGQILQQHCYTKALLSAGSQISFTFPPYNSFPGCTFMKMGQLLSKLLHTCEGTNVLLVYQYTFITWDWLTIIAFQN